MKNKKGMSKWIWILIVLIILIGIGAYFLLTGDATPVASGENSIPQPPALPS